MEEVKNIVLGKYWQQCKDAHVWSSFYPERRATQMVKEWSEQLENDLKELGENQGNYKEKFVEKWLKWVSSKSNCASTMITGGANFNVRRNEKALNREQANYENLTKWREKYFSAVNRVKTLSPEEELDNALAELDEVSNRQEMMKEINSSIRKHGKGISVNEQINLLIKEGFPNKIIEDICERNGVLKFMGFQLTNNNAKIKRLKDKVLTMKHRIETKNTFDDIQFDGGYVTIEDDRFKIFHDEKPSKEVIQEIKSNGFRWSPHWKCWCRKHTSNALRVVNQLSFIN